jgi:hypothetical protein
MLSKESGPCSILSSIWVYFDFSCRVSYRFRLVSISCDPNFTFSIDNHTMTVIEVEGTNTQPLLIDSLQIFAGARGLIQVLIMLIDVKTGQRYSVVVFLSYFLPQEGAQLSVGQR